MEPEDGFQSERCSYEDSSYRRWPVLNKRSERTSAHRWFPNNVVQHD